MLVEEEFDQIHRVHVSCPMERRVSFIIYNELIIISKKYF